MDVHAKLFEDDVGSDEDDITGSLSVGEDFFDQLYLKELPISLAMLQISTIERKYKK